MKQTLQWILPCLLLPLCACDSKDEEALHATVSQEIDDASDIISLAELRKRPTDYKNRKVTVAAYLFTHEEGPWIGPNLKSPLDDTLPLIVRDTTGQIFTQNPKLFRSWFEWQGGFPALVTGTLQTGDFNYPNGRTIHTWIEASHATEVETSDPRWSGHQ